jgi:hypothetical protein
MATERRRSLLLPDEHAPSASPAPRLMTLKHTNKPLRVITQV